MSLIKIAGAKSLWTTSSGLRSDLRLCASASLDLGLASQKCTTSGHEKISNPCYSHTAPADSSGSYGVCRAHDGLAVGEDRRSIEDHGSELQPRHFSESSYELNIDIWAIFDGYSRIGAVKTAQSIGSRRG